eukprot:scaffold209192_cov18-Tisochrysis_lutea.AAC.1
MPPQNLSALGKPCPCLGMHGVSSGHLSALKVHLQGPYALALQSSGSAFTRLANSMQPCNFVRSVQHQMYAKYWVTYFARTHPVSSRAWLCNSLAAVAFPILTQAAVCRPVQTLQ